jgi:hypothetical protein
MKIGKVLKFIRRDDKPSYAFITIPGEENAYLALPDPVAARQFTPGREVVCDVRTTKDGKRFAIRAELLRNESELIRMFELLQTNAYALRLSTPTPMLDAKVREFTEAWRSSREVHEN